MFPIKGLTKMPFYLHFHGSWICLGSALIPVLYSWGCQFKWDLSLKWYLYIFCVSLSLVSISANSVHLMWWLKEGHFRAGKWVHVSSLLLSRWVTLDNNDYPTTHILLGYSGSHEEHLMQQDVKMEASIQSSSHDMSYSDTKSSHRQFTKKMSLNWFKISWTSHQL